MTRAILFGFVATAAVMAATSAHASVESMAEPRDGDRNCASAQENNRFALWRPADGRLVIGGEGKARFEFYGHGIDLSPNAELTGISGASARRVDARGGAVNGARGCGNIGSIIVEIDLPGVGAANNGTLRIGSETVAFTATPRVAQNAEWDDANRADGRASGGAVAGAAAPAPSPPVKGGNNSNLPCTGPGCPGPANSIQAPTSSGTTLSTPDTRTLPKCADPHGMKGEISNSGRDLTLTLPTVRTGAIETCYGRHLLTTFVTKGVNDAITLSGPSPTLRMTATGLDASFRQQDGLKDKAGLITLDADLLKTFVGRRTFDVDITPGSSARLKLTLKSEPAYGPKAIAAPIVNPNIGRTSSDMVLKITTWQAAGTGETFAWKLTPTDGAPANCFAQTAGSVTAPTGATGFDLALRATEAAGCSGKRFQATIATASVASPTGTPFEQSVTFLLPAVSIVNVPDQNRTTPPVTRPRM